MPLTKNKEMELEPEKLIPYLPHSLKVEMEGKKCNVAWMSTKNIAVIRPNSIGEYKRIKWEYAHLNIKPYLRSLSQLTEEDWKEEIYQHYESRGIEIKVFRVYDSGNDDKDDFGLSVTYKLMDEAFTDLLISSKETDETPRHFMEFLYKNHFDVDQLIPNNLALEIK